MSANSNDALLAKDIEQALRKGTDCEEKKLIDQLEIGTAISNYYYGRLYFEGRCIEKDLQASRKLMLESAQNGFLPAQRFLGFAFTHGSLGEKNYEQAIEWLTKSASQGDMLSQRWLGDLLSLFTPFIGRRPDYESAMAWYAAAASQGDLTAKLGLSYLLATSPIEELRDASRAIELSLEVEQTIKTPEVYDTIAAAYAEDGKYNLAIENQERALSLLPDSSPKKPLYENKLSLYKMNKPFRLP